jgi:hypothetical protein
MPYLCGRNLRAAIFRGNAVDEGADGGAARLGILLRGLLSRGVHEMPIREFSDSVIPTPCRLLGDCPDRRLGQDGQRSDTGWTVERKRT